ncbi:MAG: glycosyltransferase family 1 protein [Ferruginibacter sp.]
MDKKIKIFVDAHSFDKELQGAQTFIRELYTAILKHHPDVDVYMGAYNTNRIATAFPALDETRILKYKHIGIRRMLSDIPALIKKYRFDYAHFQYVSPRSINNCRYIVTLHDLVYKEMPQYFPPIYSKLRSIFFKKYFLRAQVKTTVSEYSRQSISKHYGTPVSEIHVIPNAVDHSFGEHFISADDARKKINSQYALSNYILYVSRIEPRKNHVLLLKTYLSLELYKKNIPLVFIGNKSMDVPELSALLNSLKAEQKKYIHFLSNIPQEDLAAFYTACILFVYPSKGEGFGIPPLEAAICGAPVLCSNVTAMKDFYFFDPYTFDPDDEADFKNKLQDMINNPVPAGFTGEVSKKIEQNYSWEKSAVKFYKLLQPVSS